MARSFYLLVAGFALVAPSAAAPYAQPLPQGRYCLKEAMVNDFDPGRPPVGHFEMYLKVSKRGGHYDLSLWNVQPFAGPILEAATDHASLLKDGSLAFRFVDGWENEGRARVHPNGLIVLTKTKASPRNAARNVVDGNYGTFRLTPEACADGDFARYR